MWAGNTPGVHAVGGRPGITKTDDQSDQDRPHRANDHLGSKKGSGTGEGGSVWLYLQEPFPQFGHGEGPGLQ